MSELNSPESGDAFRQGYHSHSLYPQPPSGKPIEVENVKAKKVQNNKIVENAFTATQEAFSKYIQADAVKEEKLTEAIREDKRKQARTAAKRKACEVKREQRTELMQKTDQILNTYIHIQLQA